MSKRRQSYTGIEIGTSVIKTVMAEPDENDDLHYLGHQEISSINRVVKGEVVNAAAVADLLAEALTKLETSSGQRVEQAYVAITGMHIASLNVKGVVPITGKIRDDDVVLATEQALAYKFPIDQTPVHSFQRTYLIDGRRRCSNPVDFVANQLTADVHFIYGHYNSIQSQLQIVADTLGRPATDMAFAGIADFYGLTRGRPQPNGLLIVDVGAGITEFVVFHEDGCVHSGQIAVGCEHLANDLALGLDLPITRCRNLLRKHGRALRKPDSMGKQIEVNTTTGRPPRHLDEYAVQTVIELRLRELFELILADLKEHQVLDVVGSPLLLCGGGAAIPEVEVLARNTMGLPVNVGYPVDLLGLPAEINSPRFVTPVGLVHLGHHLDRIQPQQQTTIAGLLGILRTDFSRIIDFCRGSIRF